jgi:hypothetical protein
VGAIGAVFFSFSGFSCSFFLQKFFRTDNTPKFLFFPKKFREILKPLSIAVLRKFLRLVSLSTGEGYLPTCTERTYERHKKDTCSAATLRHI